MSDRIYFSLSPVQGFVTRSRRTRDLWAGSWLLSYLAESAIAAAEEEQAEVLLPYRADKDRGSVTMVRDQATFGVIPNRFVAWAPDPVRAAKAAESGLRRAWNQIATAVWDEYLAPVAELGRGTEQIWKRQVDSYWDVNWVVGGVDDAAALKSVRLVDARVEPGVHCSLMGELQELSGYFGRGAARPQQEFWGAVRSRTPPLDIQENERLSAIALIKRLFPYLGEQAVSVDLSKVRNWPSTAWMAALPWILRVLGSRRGRDLANVFVDSLTSLQWGGTMLRNEFESASRILGGDLSRFSSLDGTLFFDSVLAAPDRIDHLAVTETTDLQVGHLRDIYREVGGEPSPFYAILALDGDHLGRVLSMISDHPSGSGEGPVSKALTRFSNKVDEVVSEHRGYTIYAGGDDVLALLPVDSALDCAVALERSYRDAFREVDEVAEIATASAALVYAHYRGPLRRALQETHRLLDSIAKDRTGRNALAIGIIQTGGLTSEWSAPWEIIRGEYSTDGTGLREFSENLSDYGVFNPTYLYNLRHRFSSLFDENRVQYSKELPSDLFQVIAKSEHARKIRSELSTDVPDSLFRQLELLAKRVYHDIAGEVQVDDWTFDFAGIRTAAFLARGGVIETGTEAKRKGVEA